METDFIYWRHPTLPGIKVEEVCGGEDKKGRLWEELALQVYCENGKDGYREIGHFQQGAPFVNGEESRISLSHTSGLLVVATLPATPEVELSDFSLRAAMGVDAERLDRVEQVRRVQSKFLSTAEKELVGEDGIKLIVAWTAKEAAYKAVLGDGLDLIEDIRIEQLPGISPAVPVYEKSEFPEITYGRAIVRRQAKDESGEREEVELSLYSYESEDCIVTLAFSPKCAKFGSKF
ncbi:MAG: 4-phosphopantetheinyl transferase family protein [Bacteroidales bacterium]|nr:4-phosphopantetheinyl transferase family protein [Bacteroidales bacterium]